MRSDYDVVVVGGGIVGAACALECAREGLSVAVLEERIIGGGATAAGMGHVVIMDDSEAQLALTRYSRELWDDLLKRLPPGCEVWRCGTLWVAADSEEMEEVDRKHRLYGESGVESRILDAEELRREEPNLRSGLAGGLLVPGDSVVYPPRVASFLLGEARELGAEVLVGERVVALGEREVRLGNGTSVAGRYTVNATGTRAPMLSPGLAVRPRRGHLVITERYPGFVQHQLIELGYVKRAHVTEGESVAFNVQPRPTGQLLIGSSRQFDTEDEEPEPGLLGRMLAHALGFVPGLAALLAIRAWTGLRAATPDNLPLIGPHPEIPWLLVATGHEGLGITTSLATAKLIVAYVTQAPRPILAEPYLPSRFAAHA